MAQQLMPQVDEIINNLSESEFWKLVSVRLNIPLSKNQMEEEGVITDANKREFWTEDFLIEEIFLRLALTKQILKHHADDCGITVYKYYNQAFRLFKWIPIVAAAKPTPETEFIVNMSNLNNRIIAELKALDKDGCQYVLKQAVGRIFENIDPRRYHLSIARNLEVVLKP